MDSTNVEQLNDLMAMRYIGNSDADGDGSTAAQGDTDERVDVVNNSTDAATNETNLDYAGAVDTASDIEDAIAKAMGDKADADSATFGLRAAALDKIAAFAQAVNGLANQAAYDAYIADGNNAAGIPNAQDYNNAGVLDLTDSTAGITDALATAINAKLFTGGATSDVNTVTELQPFVDSANEIVNKIAAYANGTWTEGNSEIDYVDLVYTFANGDFSEDAANVYYDAASTSSEISSNLTGQITGWQLINQQIILGENDPTVDDRLGVYQGQLAGEIEPESTTFAAKGTGTYAANGVDDNYGGGTTSVVQNFYNTASTDLGNWNFMSIQTISGVQTVPTQNDGTKYYDPDDSGTHGDVLELGMALDHRTNDGSSSGSGSTSTYRGPAVVSTESFYLSAGDKVSFDWRSLYLNDQYDVYGYLAKVDATAASDHITILDAEGDGSSSYANFTTPWTTNSVTLQNGEEGEYKFVFVAGSWDTHQGTQVGSLLWLDNIKIELASGLAPIVFAGVEFDGDNFTQDLASLKAAQQVFDRETAEGTGFVTSSASDATPALLGWKDDGTFNKEPAVLQSVRITSSKLNTTGTPADGFDNSVLPKRFVVEGWDQSQNAWVQIQSFDDDTAISTDFAVTGQNYLEFNITSDQAFTGFRVKVLESFGGDGVIELSELDFMSKPANQVANQLDKTDFEQIGIVGVTDDNLSAINAGLFALSDASSVSMISGIQQHVDNVVAALGKITNFANSNGAGDDDGDFTLSGSESLVPAVADYNAIGLHFYRTSDGRYHEITTDNIAAINEIFALSEVGAGDTYAATTFENIKAVLENQTYSARLTAIEKISQLATVTATSIGLDAANLADGDILTLKLSAHGIDLSISATLTTDTANKASLASALNDSLPANSGYEIGYNSSTEKIDISRIDGASFTLAESSASGDSTGSWTLTDGSTTITGDEDGANVIKVTSSLDNYPVVSDFTAAGVLNVDANNISRVTTYIANGTDSASFDTNSELTSIVPTLAALDLILAYAQSDGTSTAPDLDDFAQIGVFAYDTVGSSTALDLSNLDAVLEILASSEIGTASSDVYTLTNQESIQNVLNAADNVARLDAIAKIAAYAEDSNSNPAPSVPDYAALGITVAEDDLSATNSRIDASTQTGADTLNEILALIPQVPQVAAFFAEADPSIRETLNVGDSLLLMIGTTEPLNAASGGLVEALLDNGASVTLRPVFNADFGGVLLSGTYTVSEGDATTTDLDVVGLQQVSGDSLPASLSGTPLDLNIPTGVTSLAQSFDIEVTDYQPPKIETLTLSSDTGLFANDLVTSTAYQFDNQEGSIRGTFNPVLDAEDKFVAISTSFEGQTRYDASGDFKNTLSALDNGSNSLFSDPSLGQWLSEYSRTGIVYTNTSEAIADASYEIGYVKQSGDTQSISFTASSNDLETVISSILTNGTWATEGFSITRSSDGYSIQRDDGEDFSITFSQNLVDLGLLEYRDNPFDGNSVPITSQIDVDNGNTDVSSSFQTKVKTGTLATVVYNGDGSSQAETQTVSIQAYDRDGPSFNADVRFGDTIVEFASGFPRTATSSDIASGLQWNIDAAFGSANVARPVISVGTIGSPDANGNILVDLTFTWSHNSNSNVDYKVVVDDDRSTTLVEQQFDFTLDQTVATTPIVASSVSNSGADVSSNISGVTAGEYVYLIKNDQTTVLNNLSSAPQTALDNLRNLSDELWSRSKVASDGSVDLTTVGLVDGTYSVVAMDLAGNFSTVATNTIEVTGSSAVSSDALFDAMFEGIDFDGGGIDTSDTSATAGTDASGDNTAVVYIETSDMAVGDTVELFADGLLVYSNKMTEGDIAAGKIQTDEINFATEADDLTAGEGNTEVQNDDKVILEIKVKHGDHYVQENANVTWEYQW